MSPKTLARLTGASSLVLLIGGVVAQGLIANRLISSRDAAVTATNILAHTQLYRLAFTAFLVEMVAQTAMTTLFYVLLRPVNRTAAPPRCCRWSSAWWALRSRHWPAHSITRRCWSW